MATEEHKCLADRIKACHEELRKQSKLIGPEQAWNEHSKKQTRLQEYAQAMHQLSSIWEENCTKEGLMAKSRIKWTIDYCLNYYYNECVYLEKRNRELRMLKAWAADGDQVPVVAKLVTDMPNTIRLLDVGSCFNPFALVPCFEVTAIDLCPATQDVKRGDFLRIEVKDGVPNKDADEITSLPSNYYECIVFSLLLEYIPSSEQRLLCCRKAYELLKTEGILVIITPDSQHVGKNAKLMKQWQYTLATMGFLRIKFEKLPHITCLVFRKSVNAYVAQRWAREHCTEDMKIALEIPQDSK